MMHRILGPISLFCGAVVGTPRVFRLPPSAGGQTVGQLSYQVRILDATAAVILLTLKVEHGPDGTVSTLHSTPISAVTLATAPDLVAGTAGTGMFGPYLHVVLELDRASGSGPSFVTLEVYEIRKPFA